jgi:hypothetical protein
VRKKQSGLSILTLIFVLAIGGFVAWIGIQSVPPHAEYFSIKRVMADVMKEVGDSGSRAQYAASFDKRAMIDDVKSIKGADLRLEKTTGQTILVAEYEKRVPIVSYINLVFDFQAKASSSGAVK